MTRTFEQRRDSKLALFALLMVFALFITSLVLAAAGKWYEALVTAIMLIVAFGIWGGRLFGEL